MTLPHGPPDDGRDLSTLFAPSSVCIVGASANPDSISGRPLRILQQHGFAGAIYPVNPKYDEIAGVSCYESIAALPQAADVAIIVVAAAHVPALLESCGEKGIKNAIIISSGFEEDDTAESIVADFRAAIDRYDLTVVGPNSEGIWSVPERAMMTFGSAALRDEIIEGPVSVISQSGSIGGSTARSLQTRGIGCRYFISAGNETVATAADYLDFIIREGGSKVVLLFLEGINDGERFLAAAERARAAGVTVVALKAGASEAGSLAAASHTGKITSPAAVYANVFEQAGVIQVDTISHLVDAAEVLVTPSLALPRRDQGAGIGPGVALVAPGATRTVMADTAERMGVPLATFASGTEAALDALIPSYGYAKNPVDVTAQLSTSGMFGDVLELMANDPATEALLIQWGNRGVHQVDEVRKAARAVQHATGKPVLIGVLGDRWELSGEARRAFREDGVGCGSTPEEVLQQLSWLYRARELHATGGEGRPLVAASASRPGCTWDEVSPWLAECGFEVPVSVSIDTSLREGDWENLIESAGLRWPVAVKAHPDAVLHKADRGLVVLGVDDLPSALEVLHSLCADAPDVERFVVQEMAPRGVEALVTVRRDPDFGPILTIGIGGALVEIVNDVRHIALPGTLAQIENAIARTRLSALLDGARGGEAADAEALLDAVAGLAARYPAHADDLDELELNPVIVGAKGEGAWAVDVIAR